MMEGACNTRMQKLKDLWAKSESDHYDLLDDEDTDSSDNYFKNDVYNQAEELYLISLGLFQDYLYELNANRPQTSNASPTEANIESFGPNQAKLPQIV